MLEDSPNQKFAANMRPMFGSLPCIPILDYDSLPTFDTEMKRGVEVTYLLRPFGVPIFSDFEMSSLGRSDVSKGHR